MKDILLKKINCKNKNEIEMLIEDMEFLGIPKTDIMYMIALSALNSK